MSNFWKITKEFETIFQTKMTLFQLNHSNSSPYVKLKPTSGNKRSCFSESSIHWNETIHAPLAIPHKYFRVLSATPSLSALAMTWVTVFNHTPETEEPSGPKFSIKLFTLSTSKLVNPVHVAVIGERRSNLPLHY